MLLSWILFAAIILGYFFFTFQKNRKEKRVQTEEDNRKALLEAILKNSKDRYRE